MKQTLHFILMADVINSSQMPQNKLIKDFKKIITTINKSSKKEILSPLTITLGDEFQGIAKDLKSALTIIFRIEEAIIAEGVIFKLRYVLIEGKIETKINTKIAYEMLGDGLTRARNILSHGKNTTNRFFIQLTDNKLSEVLNDLFIVFQGIVDDWDQKRDYDIVSNFLLLRDYKAVAEKMKKDRSLMWKREKSIKIKEYISLKNVILHLGN